MKKHIKSIRQDPNETLVHVIIPSAGIGRRMKSYGCKSLLNIRDKKLIDIQVENIRNVFPTNEIILVTGFDSDRLINNSPTDIIKIENEITFIEINFRVLDKFLSSLENNNKSYPELDLILLKNKPNISIQKKSTYLSNKFKKKQKNKRKRTKHY